MKRTKDEVIADVLGSFDFEAVNRIRDLELALGYTSSRLTLDEMRYEAGLLLADVLDGHDNPVSSFGFQAFRCGTEIILQYVVTEGSTDIYGRKKD